MMPPGMLGTAPIQPSTPPGMSSPGAAPRVVAAQGGSMITCPRCGTPTPVGFAYCQQCGLHMQALQPTDPGASARPRPPSSPAPFGPSVGTSPNTRPVAPGINPHAPIDPQGATLAADGIRGGSMQPPTAQSASAVRPLASPGAATGPAWGTAILVNRDGSDGQRYPLAGEYSVIGRAGADIPFEEDRFLARQHARFERAGDGTVKVLPLDTLNGVFRKADAPVDLADGMTILVGREVLRFEKVDPEETKVHPLIRHGVALFGSPPREPWGRFVQIVPSGGYRDVRHLAGEEIVLGREEGDIVFRDDAFMSRRHAAVTWDGKRAQITDLGSSNGTFVRVTGPTVIKHGDHVRMGDQLLRIELGK
jgi:pSer/pThr/pTyr-binding forkhead associated (FHA) protein